MILTEVPREKWEEQDDQVRRARGCVNSHALLTLALGNTLIHIKATPLRIFERPFDVKATACMN